MRKKKAYRLRLLSFFLISTPHHTYGREYDFLTFDFEIAEQLLTEVNHALKDRHMTPQLQ
mgnify:CR=1 FL=1